MKFIVVPFLATEKGGGSIFGQPAGTFAEDKNINLTKIRIFWHLQVNANGISLYFKKMKASTAQNITTKAFLATEMNHKQILNLLFFSLSLFLLTGGEPKSFNF